MKPAKSRFLLFRPPICTKNPCLKFHYEAIKCVKTCFNYTQSTNQPKLALIHSAAANKNFDPKVNFRIFQLQNPDFPGSWPGMYEYGIWLKIQIFENIAGESSKCSSRANLARLVDSAHLKDVLTHSVASN